MAASDRLHEDPADEFRPALAPIVGAATVAGIVTRTAMPPQPTPVNGRPALMPRLNDEIDTGLAVRAGKGHSTGLYAVRNPGKPGKPGA